MKSAYVVIGANFGDEAKGKTVDAIVDRLINDGKKPFVCRFNGGGQAGHTVIHNGIRHVFSHVGAGALRGVGTYLSSHFITNFFTLKKELDELSKLGKFSEVIINPNSRVTLMCDMIINSMIERRRGTNRHGSCGLGINETVTRSEAEGGKFRITAYDVDSAAFHPSGIELLAKRMLAICNEWIPLRLHEMGFTRDQVDPWLIEMTSLESLFKQAEEMVKLTINRITILNGNFIASGDHTVVFEGAQGLMLDEHLGFFPHVTRSITGLPNAIEAAHELGITNLIPIYTTRAYLTRHGAGPLSHEGEKFAEVDSVIDQTNIENEWQGQIRYAPLNLSLMYNFIQEDIRRGQYKAPQYNVKIQNAQIALHCLDQIGAFARIYDIDNKPKQIETDKLAEFVASQLGLPVSVKSDGPTAENVYFSW